MGSLALTRLELANFRNYESFALEDIGMLTILAGPNAVGKTNVVEGLQLLTAQTSFRHPLLSQLVRNGEGSARLSALVEGDKRRLDLETFIAAGKKTHRLNGKAKSTAELKGLMPSVVFTPDDLGLVKGSMGVRRRGLDDMGSQLSANHYLIRKDYEKLLQHKNRALKEGAPDVVIESLNETLAKVGSTLHAYRAALFDKLLGYMAAHYSRIVEGRETLTGAYVASWDVGASDDMSGNATAAFSGRSSAGADLEACFGNDGYTDAGEQVGLSLDGKGPVAGVGATEAVINPESTLFPVRPTREELHERYALDLARKLPQERLRGRSLTGPHADQVHLYIDGLPVEHFASQGQQRSVVLAWKLAEVSLVQDVLGQQPILLLDDVMSELDAARRNALVDFLADDIQTFITTTNLAYFDESLLERARVVQLGTPNT